MKKQLFRVKQLADQAIARTDKSEVLTEDLVASERRVEALRTSCSLIRKRLTESLSGNPTDDVSKRAKKIAEHQLGTAMKESAAVVGPDTVLGVILSECGQAQTRLAQERLNYETELEQTVLENSVLQQLLDNDIPNVTKLRKTLTRLTQDMNATRSRYQNAQRHTATGMGAGRETQQKTETVREELDSAQTRVEQHRDTLAGDMFQLLSREPELAQLMLHLIKLQTEYYRSSVQLLEATLPGLQASINAAAQKPVFGLSLEEHLRLSGREVAYPLEMCVCRLIHIGTDEEGLFRVAGSASKVRKLKSCFDAGLVDSDHMLEYRDPHVVADALKSYLRDLPEPLMTTDFYDEWMAAARVQEEGSRLQALWQVVHQLPESYYINLRYLIKFLALLCQNQQVNKMTTQNVAIVMAPNLLWARMDEGFNMTATGTHSLVLDSLITHCHWFFPEEVDFFITYPRELSAPAGDSPPLPASPSLSNGAVRSSGHQRSKSSDSHVLAALDSSTQGESTTDSTASLASEPSLSLHCDSPKPTLRRKKQAAPAPPSHRQTVAPTLPTQPQPTAATQSAPSHTKPDPGQTRSSLDSSLSQAKGTGELIQGDSGVGQTGPHSESSPSHSKSAESSPRPIGFESVERLVRETDGNGSDVTPDSVDSGSMVRSAPASITQSLVTSTVGSSISVLGRSSGGLPQPVTGSIVDPSDTCSHATKSAAISQGNPSAQQTVQRNSTATSTLQATPSASQGNPSPPQRNPCTVQSNPPASGPPEAAAAKPAPFPVPAPRAGAVTSHGGKSARPERPPPPLKLVERAQSFTPSDTVGGSGGITTLERQKPAIPERPGTLLRKSRNSAELPKDPVGGSEVPSAPPSGTDSSHAPPGAGIVEPRPRTRPVVQPPPVPAPRTENTNL